MQKALAGSFYGNTTSGALTSQFSFNFSSLNTRHFDGPFSTDPVISRVVSFQGGDEHRCTITVTLNVHKVVKRR